ncbi:hypothetical protein U9M48_032450 [Paspalum notatum var. saurae]|uniref:Disease resistance R13L4/SHOC-2-like LRR domain-containing protein n=1 Tax=Paspalum notatum var. saurae TaxID=547442 RepID=A0AAQ3U540_PASNO
MPPPEDDAGRRTKDPMDELVDFLKRLPEMYRLNVLDLGGCRGLKRRHLESFGKQVACLKYLSLRNTDVPPLEARHINRLTLLETLDIRETIIPTGDTKDIYLPKLKHLLADRRRKLDDDTMWMPNMIGQMKNMETLSHVQVSNDGAELEGVVKLRSRQQLRKLGVVVHGNPRTAAYLGRLLYALAGCLRSLSIWVATQTQTLDIPSMPPESTSRVLENLDINGKMTSFPSWIGGRDQKLANVTLRDTAINGGEALRRLASVPNLRCLRLFGQAFTEQVLVFKGDVCFKVLRVLVIEGNDAITSMEFDAAAGAALKLEKIVWAIGSGGGSDSRIKKKTGTNDDGHLITVSGIHNLPGLKVIEVRGDFNLPNLLVESKKKAAAAAAAAHDNNKPRWYDCRYVSSDGNNLIHEVKVAVVASDRDSTSLSLPKRI